MPISLTRDKSSATDDEPARKLRRVATQPPKHSLQTLTVDVLQRVLRFLPRHTHFVFLEACPWARDAVRAHPLSTLRDLVVSVPVPGGAASTETLRALPLYRHSFVETVKFAGTDLRRLRVLCAEEDSAFTQKILLVARQCCRALEHVAFNLHKTGGVDAPPPPNELFGAWPRLRSIDIGGCQAKYVCDLYAFPPLLRRVTVRDFHNRLTSRLVTMLSRLPQRGKGHSDAIHVCLDEIEDEDVLCDLVQTLQTNFATVLHGVSTLECRLRCALPSFVKRMLCDMETEYIAGRLGGPGGAKLVFDAKDKYVRFDAAHGCGADAWQKAEKPSLSRLLSLAVMHNLDEAVFRPMPELRVREPRTEGRAYKQLPASVLNALHATMLYKCRVLRTLVLGPVPFSGELGDVAHSLAALTRVLNEVPSVRHLVVDNGVVAHINAAPVQALLRAGVHLQSVRLTGSKNSRSNRHHGDGGSSVRLWVSRLPAFLRLLANTSLGLVAVAVVEVERFPNYGAPLHLSLLHSAVNSIDELECVRPALDMHSVRMQLYKYVHDSCEFDVPHNSSPPASSNGSGSGYVGF